MNETILRQAKADGKRLELVGAIGDVLRDRNGRPMPSLVVAWVFERVAV